MSTYSIVMCCGMGLFVLGAAQTLVAPDEGLRVPVHKAARAAAASGAAALIFAVAATVGRTPGVATGSAVLGALVALVWSWSDFEYWKILRTADLAPADDVAYAAIGALRDVESITAPLELAYVHDDKTVTASIDSGIVGMGQRPMASSVRDLATGQVRRSLE